MPLLALASLVQVPAATYLRYCALLVVGDADAALDPIPERRAAIRADGSGEADDADESDDPDGSDENAESVEAGEDDPDGSDDAGRP